jgi:hypothetical protein
MLAEMLGPDAGAIEMLAIEIECREQQMSADVTGRLLAWADVTGRCWQTMLA